MIYNFLGFERKAGEYNGRPYDNLSCLFTRPADTTKEGAGIMPACQGKIRYSNLGCVFVSPDGEAIVNTQELAGYLKAPCNVFFNQYGNVDLVQFLKAK